MWTAIYIVKKSQFQFKPNWIENTNYNTKLELDAQTKIHYGNWVYPLGT